ncbi:MAG: PAC2 family protein [Candidatus Lokiarchaeia archaeon]
MYDINVKTYGTIPEKLNNPICIQGLPDISNVGTEAVKQLANGLKAEKVMELGFDDLPPIIIIKDGIPHLPTIRIQFWKDPKNKQDIFFITGDDQPMTSRGIYGISHYLANLMSEKGVKLIVTLGAYIVESPASRNNSTKIYIATTHKENEHLQKLLSLPNAKPMTEGEILGANGIVPTLAKQKFNIDGLIILSETSMQLASMGSNDPKAIKALIETLKKYFNLPIENIPTTSQKHPETSTEENPLNKKSQETNIQSSYIC